MPRLPAAGRATFQALEIPNYRRYIAGQAISLSGTWMQMAAQAWLVLSLTGSAAALGLVVAAQTLPILLFGAYGGVIADRIDKRRAMIVLQGLMGVQALALGVLTVTGAVRVWQIALLAAGQLREGLRYIRRTPNLLIPLAMMAAVGTLGYEFQVTLPVLARQGLHVGAAGYGFMTAAMGGGAVLGGLIVATIGRTGLKPLVLGGPIVGAVMGAAGARAGLGIGAVTCLLAATIGGLALRRRRSARPASASPAPASRAAPSG
jgi:MFS family permease